MRYDLARARILLRDLEQIGRKHMPVAQLTASTESGPVVVGTCTRLGLMRLGVHLALAALEARTDVAIHANGAVTEDARRPGGLIKVWFADQQPRCGERAEPWWSSGYIAKLAAAVLCIIGAITVVRWIVGLLGG